MLFKLGEVLCVSGVTPETSAGRLWGAPRIIPSLR